MDGESQPLLQNQDQQQQQQMVPLQDTYMQSRAEALQNVESTIHELGSIFNQLATLVSQQGEIAIRYCLLCQLASNVIVLSLHKLSVISTSRSLNSIWGQLYEFLTSTYAFKIILVQVLYPNKIV